MKTTNLLTIAAIVALLGTGAAKTAPAQKNKVEAGRQPGQTGAPAKGATAKKPQKAKEKWSPRRKKINGVNYLVFDDIARRGKMTKRSNGNTSFFLAKSGFRAELSEKSITAKVNGVKYSLFYKTISDETGMLLSVADWNHTLRLLLTAQPQIKRRPVKTIVIDPGHGGKDRGASGKTLVEKRATLKISQRLAAILRSQGYHVVLTRPDDRYVGLKERPKIQRMVQGDLFVSIHLNAVNDSTVNGIETFCLTPPGEASSNDRKGKKRTKCPGNDFDVNSLVLADRVQRQLLYRTGANDRGVKRARYAVLKTLSCPGILTEVGFLSNPQEEKRLSNNVYIERIAQAIASGITSYHGEMKRR